MSAEVEKALADLRRHFAPLKPKSIADSARDAAAMAKLSTQDRILCELDGLKGAMLRREERLTDTLLIVIDHLAGRLADLEEQVTQP
ncbi:hypothetical protein [Sphingomonas phyllosphaerae]|uniref:hypothetical protein n=1 Tax=Sphingomonas phyllosphaerae TaxID=257003 RepID=UPI0003B4F784|nr:hypothetical protein [Sphingomonas phyllosphaerae]